MSQRDFFRDHGRPGPKAGDISRQMRGESFQKVFLEDTEDALQQRIFTIIGRTNPPFHFGPRRGLAGFDRRQPGGFGTRQTILEIALITLVCESRRNVVEKHREGSHTGLIKTDRFTKQNVDWFTVGEAKSFTRMKAVNEVDLVALGLMDQPQELLPFHAWVGAPPTLAVVRIVLWRIEISVHAARGGEFEKRFAVRHGPRGTEKSLDNAAPLKRCSGRH
jgi:hypothetical protein